MDIRLTEFYNNLKNFDFDVHGYYKVDISEAKKIMAALDELKEKSKED